ncbi:MAG TPA: amidohydrolase family protein [Solirubrobacter sp.]|nr:amidohydrolase family protein [Solirubrobacter sp.]
MPVFDAHFHVIDARFPLVANQGYLPPPFTVEDYRARVAGLDVAGGAVVSGSFQAFDQTYLVDALARLGDGFVGVANLPEDVTDEEILALDAAGVRACRANLHRGSDFDFVRLARRVHEIAGWHLEVYGDPADPRLHAVPRLVIDHLGLRRSALPALLKLVEAGAYVKATGFGRVDHDVPAALRAIAAVNPEALLFGTDLPSTRAPRPFQDADVEIVREHAGERALWQNAANLYLR